MAKHDPADDKLDRRAFLQIGLRKAATSAVDAAQTRLQQRAAHYIRPPFALDELDFLLKCTRCHDCCEACPHDLIFPLPARLGVEVVATPALDLANGACQLCDGWPCVAACEVKALQLPQLDRQTASLPQPKAEASESGGEPPALSTVAGSRAPQPSEPDSARVLPMLARAAIDPEHCLPFRGPECGACASSCPVPGALEFEMTRPVINEELCIGCAACRAACITSPKSITISSLARIPKPTPGAQ